MGGGAAARGVYGADSDADGLLPEVAGCAGVSFDSVPELLVCLGGRTFSGPGVHECACVRAHRPSPGVRLRAVAVEDGAVDWRGLLAPDRGAPVRVPAGVCGVRRCVP